VQEKAIAHPVDSRLLDMARAKVVQAARRVGIALKQTFSKEGKALRRKAGGYAHAKQFKRLRRTVKRQRTILGIVLREVQRKLPAATSLCGAKLSRLNTLLERAERIRTQQPKDKNKLYALHAPEAECIGKGKARKPYEFGVKASIAVTHRSGLMVGARTFPGNPYDGHILAAQLEQTGILLEDVGRVPNEVVVDLGYRGVDLDNSNVEIIHRGKYKSLTVTAGSIQAALTADCTAASVAQAPPSRGACYWAFEVRSPNGSLLAPGPAGECVACSAVRYGLQPEVADAGHGSPGVEGDLFAPVLVSPAGCNL
jgi:IS5 family transposase